MSTQNNDNYKSSVAIALSAAEELRQAEDRQFDRPEYTARPAADSGGTGGGAWVAPDTIEVRDRLRELNMLVSGSDLGPEIRDQYRRIKRPLLSNAFGKTASLVDRGNLVMVTSAVPGEGKSYSAVNLALAIAQERDHTVLLVDCDITKQGVSRMFSIDGRPGITDVIDNDYFAVGDAMLRTDIPSLVVLPAGQHNEYVTEMLASKRMADMVEEISSRYSDRFIIFDSPPLLPTPQTQVLAGLMGQIVVVVEAGKTPHSVVEDALSQLPEEKAVGLVLNKSESLSNRGGYYYGYYTPYGESSD